MNTSLRTVLSGLAIAAATVPAVAVPAGAAVKHPTHKTTKTVKKATKTAAVVKTTPKASVAAPAPVATPAPAPTVNSVISIGGYVFYNLSYADAVAAYQLAVANAPAGYTPPPVTSISVTTTVGGTV